MIIPLELDPQRHAERARARWIERGDAAAQWLTQPDFATQLVNRLRQLSGKLPRYYQVILNVQFRDGIPLQSSYVLHRVLRQ